MAYLTEKEYSAAISGWCQIDEISNSIAKEYVKEFCGKREYLIDIEIKANEGEIEIHTEAMYCGCCPGDDCYYSLPIAYLWDDDWKDKERDRRAEQKRIADEVKQKQDERKEKERKEARLKTYLSMKKEFENE